MDPQQIRADAMSLTEGLTSWAMHALPNLVAAIVIMIAGYWLSGWLARQVGHVVDDLEHFEPTLRAILTQLVRYAIFVIALVACAVTTFLQVRTWRDSFSVYARSLAIEPRNAVLLNNLGMAYHATGRKAEANACLTEAGSELPESRASPESSDRTDA